MCNKRTQPHQVTYSVYIRLAKIYITKKLKDYIQHLSPSFFLVVIAFRGLKSFTGLVLH